MNTLTTSDEEIQYRFYEQLPLCDITDVLRFVNEQCRYLPVFTHIQPRYTKLLADENSLNAVIIAQALNNGNLNMAEISDIPYDRLLDVYQSRVRLQTLKQGNDLISNDITISRFTFTVHPLRIGFWLASFAVYASSISLPTSTQDSLHSGIGSPSMTGLSPARRS